MSNIWSLQYHPQEIKIKHPRKKMNAKRLKDKSQDNMKYELKHYFVVIIRHLDLVTSCHNKTRSGLFPIKRP